MNWTVSSVPAEGCVPEAVEDFDSNMGEAKYVEIDLAMICR